MVPRPSSPLREGERWISDEDRRPVNPHYVPSGRLSRSLAMAHREPVRASRKRKSKSKSMMKGKKGSKSMTGKKGMKKSMSMKGSKGSKGKNGKSGKHKK